MVSSPLPRALTRPWQLLALAVLFMAGLVLPIWWLVAGPVGRLPGLGAYPSAYLGDTVLLPAGCMMLMIGIGSLPPARHERAAAAVASAVAAAAALAVQAAWLRDRHPRLNWTLPRAGRFDAAGWWHAAYFTVMSAVVFGLAIMFFLRIRQDRRAGHDRAGEISAGPGAVILLTAFGSYLALVVHDSFPAGPMTGASASSLALAAVAVLLVVLLIAFGYGRLAARLIRPAVFAIGGVAAIVTFVVTPWHRQTLLTAETAAVACTAAAIGVECHLVHVVRYGRGARRTWEILGVAATICVLVAAWVRLATPLAQHDPARVAATAGACLLLLIAVLVGLLGRGAPAALSVTFVGLLVIAVAAAAAWYRAVPARLVSAASPAVTIVTIGVGLVIGLSSYAVKVRTDGVLGVPADSDRPKGRLRPDLVPQTSAALALIALFAVAGFVATFAFVLVVNRSLRLPAGATLAPADMRLLATGAVACALAITVFAVRVRLPSSRRARIVAGATQLAVPVVLSSLLIADILGGRFSALQIVEAVGAGTLLFLWTFNSALNNIWLLQGRPMGPGTMMLALSLAVLSGSGGAWILTDGIRSHAQVRSPWQAAAIALITLVILSGIVVLLGGSDGIGLPHHTELPVWRGLLQDALSGSAITLILVFPVVYLWSITSFGAGLVAALPVAAIFAVPFVWIMKANRDHPRVEAFRLIKPRSKAKALLASMEGRSIQRFARDQRVLIEAVKQPCAPRSESFVRILAAHTRNQNRLAGTMIMVPVAGALQILLNLATDSPWLAQHLTAIAWPSTIREKGSR